jgi:MFS family permease
MLIVIALGVTWILDGLEVTIVGAIGPVLQETRTLGLTAQEIGGTASAYIVGVVCGALVFGWLTDRFGRKFVFYVTLLVYLAGVLLTAHHGASGASRSFGSSPASGSAGSTSPSSRPSMNRFPLVTAGGH